MSAEKDAPVVKTSGEPIDLLAALQRSISAAKRDYVSSLSESCTCPQGWIASGGGCQCSAATDGGDS